MAVAYSSVSSEAEGNGTLTITRPSVSADDLMFAFVFAAHSSGIAITPPSGWTLLDSYNTNTSLVSASWVYYKVAGGSEPATYDWGHSGGTPNNRSTGRIIVVTGADTAAPIDVSATDLDTTAGTSQVNPSVTTTVANTLLLWYTMEWGNQSTATTWTPDAATTEAFEDTQSVAGGGHALAYESVAAIGATGTRTWTTNQNRRTWNLSIAVAPAVGGLTSSTAETVTAAETPAATMAAAQAVAETASAADTCSASLEFRVVSSPFKNNTGTLLASLTDVTVWVNALESGALVVKKTGQTTNPSGVCTVVDAAIATATAYAVRYRDEDTGAQGFEVVTSS